MSGASIRWQAGEEALRVALDRALPGMLETTAPLHAGRHRRLYRLRLDAPVPNDVVVKHYLPPVGRRRLREAIKRVAGRAPGLYHSRSFFFPSHKGYILSFPHFATLVLLPFQ